MTTFKQYAKQAKDRLKNGFWEQAKNELDEQKKVAATKGISEVKVREEQHRKLQRQIYDYDGFCEEEEFYQKVVAILTSKDIITNPLMLLADKDFMEKLSATEKQTYISKLSLQYRKAVERYHRLNN